jgi:hypothetical protein
MEARQARLEAERDGADKVTLPHDLLARRNEPDVAQATTSEQRLLRGAGIFDLRALRGWPHVQFGNQRAPTNRLAPSRNTSCFGSISCA